MGFLKSFFSGNPWTNYDPDRSFRNKIIARIGAWEFTKLEELMKSAELFSNEFFVSGKFSNCPENQRLDYFLDFINNWASFLIRDGQIENGFFILKTSFHIDRTKKETQVFLAGLSDAVNEAKSESKSKAEFPILNRVGKVAGSLSQSPDDKLPTLHIGKNFDSNAALMAIVSASFDSMSKGKKIYFSRWANLRYDKFADEHKYIFGIAFTHYLQEAKRDGLKLHPALTDYLKFVPDEPISPLPNSLTPEIRSIYDRMFDKSAAPAYICDDCGSKLTHDAKYCAECGCRL
jgi:hypothetical protein